MKSFTAMKSISTSCILKIFMNVSRELVPFFSIKKPSSSSSSTNQKDFKSLEENVSDFPTTTTTIAPVSYKIYTPALNYYIGTYLTLIVTISVLANLWVILVMLMRKRRCKSTHIFILTLAICDILYSSCIHPFLISVSFGADPHELFGIKGCNWYGFGAVFFGSLSMCIHGAISFTRYKIIVCSGDQYWHESKPYITLLGISFSLALFVSIAPVLGWGRYETFEYGCTLAFHDPSMNLRSYVVFTFFFVFTVPLASCCYFYWKIIWFSYDCKLELFLMNESEDDQLDVGTLDPLNQVNVVEDLNKKDIIIRNCNVDQTLLNAITLVDRKLTRLTLVAAIGFMVAWTPFAALCLWEMSSPPTSIPSTFRMIACLFCKSATAYNPFIYFFMGREFRDDCTFMFRIITSRLGFWRSKTSIEDDLGIYVGDSTLIPLGNLKSSPKSEGNGFGGNQFKLGNEKNIRNDNSESTMMMAVKSGKRESPKPEAKPTKKLISKDLDITYVETCTCTSDEDNALGTILETGVIDLETYKESVAHKFLNSIKNFHEVDL